MEDLGNRRVGEDLMAELIERHALGDRQTADGDDLRCCLLYTSPSPRDS